MDKVYVSWASASARNSDSLFNDPPSAWLAMKDLGLEPQQFFKALASRHNFKMIQNLVLFLLNCLQIKKYII